MCGGRGFTAKLLESRKHASIKPLLRQKRVGEPPQCTESSQEIAIDFAGSFQNAIGAKKFTLVSIEEFTGWPEAKVLRKPNTDKAIEFLKKYIVPHGIPKTIRTDPETKLRSNKFKEFCRNRIISHVYCPIRDHRGNGK